MNRRSFLSIAGAAGLSGLAYPSKTDSEPVPADHLVFQRDIPLGQAYDVVVCGGGPSGLAAALAARRSGLKVLLIDSNGQLGGNGTSGLVSHWLGGRTNDCRRWVVGGIFRSLCQEAQKRGIALIPGPPEGPYQPHGWYKGQLAAGIPFDPFGMAVLLDQTVQNAGVSVLLHTSAVDAVVEKGRITHLVMMNKSGLCAVPTTAVIDATGDADIAARIGCPFVKGRNEDGLMTPASLMLHVDNIDTAALGGYIQKNKSPRFRREIAELRKTGEWTFPYDIFISVQLCQNDTMMINTIRLTDIDGTDGRSLTEGMIRGRDEVQKLMQVMRRHFPGFAQARLKTVAPVLGIRETRRICGIYTLTVSDLAQGRDFDDTIGFSSYGWDMPDPEHPSQNPSHGTKSEAVPIPYRIMLPEAIANLICPGRAISVERPVLGPLRVMAPCMAMGEAAGVASVQVVRENKSFAGVDSVRLREQLAEHNAVVTWKS
jgi:hypothetical protein